METISQPNKQVAQSWLKYGKDRNEGNVDKTARKKISNKLNLYKHISI